MIIRGLDEHGNPCTISVSNGALLTRSVESMVFIEGITDREGRETTLVDSTKNFGINSLDNALIKFSVDGTEYIRKISASIGDTITIPATQVAMGAFVEVGSGRLGQGQVKISVAQGTGANYSVQFAAGSGIGSSAQVAYDTETGKLTVISGTDEQEQPVGVMPGNLQSLISASPATGIFTVETTFAGYPLPVETDEIGFTDDQLMVGFGRPDEGVIVIKTKGELLGTAGNFYALSIVIGEATTGDTLVDLNSQTGELLITVNKTEGGEIRFMSTTELQTLIEETEVICDLFEILEDSVQAGDVWPTEGFIAFEGGIDAIPIPAGTPYRIVL